MITVWLYSDMPQWTIDFVNEAAEEELYALPADMLARLLRIFDLIQERGLAGLGMPLARPLQGKLWELRATGRDGIARSIYAAVSGRRILVLRTFIKKTQKTTRAEIEIALGRFKEVTQ
jgi:phage-related protein